MPPIVHDAYLLRQQSGQSLIEHSYKADSDLSPAGWDYSEKLKQVVLERRAKSLEQRGFDPKERRLVVCDVSLARETEFHDKYRSGLLHVAAHIIRHGLSLQLLKNRNRESR